MKFLPFTPQQNLRQSRQQITRAPLVALCITEVLRNVFGYVKTTSIPVPLNIRHFSSRDGYYAHTHLIFQPSKNRCWTQAFQNLRPLIGVWIASHVYLCVCYLYILLIDCFLFYSKCVHFCLCLTIFFFCAIQNKLSDATTLLYQSPYIKYIIAIYLFLIKTLSCHLLLITRTEE